MQPSNLKKGRSKTRLSEKDLAKSSNYALHTQDQDSDGDIEQKIFKVGLFTATRSDIVYTIYMPYACNLKGR